MSQCRQFRRSPSSTTEAKKKVDEACLACDSPAKGLIKIPSCKHRYCPHCFEEMSLSGQKPFRPARCCNELSLDFVIANLPEASKGRYEGQFVEYSTTDRVYCRECSCFIRPAAVDEDGHRAYCGGCGHHTCTLCGSLSHSGIDCPKDDDLALLLEAAKEEGWQRCPRCKAMVERIDGCSHMQ